VIELLEYKRNFRFMNLRTLPALLPTFLLCACAATSVKKTWKSPQYQGAPLKSIAVLAVDERVLLRKGFENRLAAELQKRGVATTLTYELFSLPEIQQDRKAAAERLQAAGVQAVAILRLVDVGTRYREVRPGEERYGAFISGIETDPWYNYYSVAFADMSPTYGNLKQQVILETSLFDLKTAKGLWGAVTQTTVTETMDRVAEMDPIVQKIVGAMRKDGMIP
jgi:hypothetical protein